MSSDIPSDQSTLDQRRCKQRISLYEKVRLDMGFFAFPMEFAVQGVALFSSAIIGFLFENLQTRSLGIPLLQSHAPPGRIRLGTALFFALVRVNVIICSIAEGFETETDKPFLCAQAETKITETALLVFPQAAFIQDTAVYPTLGETVKNPIILPDRDSSGPSAFPIVLK
jgi:hypothetical protein